MNISEVAKQQHDWVESVGWHNKKPLEYLALICSEIGEAANECRGKKPTEHLGEELADIILRVFDMSVELKINIEEEIIHKMRTNRKRGNRGRLK